MFCLKWCFEGFLIICDSCGKFEIFPNICILQSSQPGGDTIVPNILYGRLEVTSLALFTKSLDL